MVSEDRLMEHGEPCSLTVTFLKKAKEHLHGGDRTFSLYEDLMPQYDFLLDRAHIDTPSPATVRLRAFYCLEVTYHLLLPRQMMANPTMSEEPFSMVFRKGVPRTRVGLETLLKALEEVNKFVVVGVTELSMTGVKDDSTRPDASVLRRGSMGKIALIVSYGIQMALHIKTSLTREEVDNLRAVGLLFAQALDAVKESPSQYLNYGTTLLNISEETGISPWDRTQQE